MKFEIQIGQKFHHLTFDGLAPKRDGDSRKYARFHCDCGVDVVKLLTKVTQGNVKSCGCLRRDRLVEFRKDMVGRRYTRLLVVCQAPTIGGVSQWECLCDCGTRKVLPLHNLSNGSTKSCGCLLRESAAIRLRDRLKGKRAKNWKGVGDVSKTYWNTIWSGAQERGIEILITHQDCADLFQKQEGKCALTGKNLGFDSIGGRSDGTASLDRIDSTKGYFIGNVQWIHKDVQRMKWAFPQDAFIDMCRAVADFHDAKNHIVGI